MPTSTLGDATLSVPEAAFVAGISERTINHEIDEGIIHSGMRVKVRTVRGGDLLYLIAVKTFRRSISPNLRRQFHEAIVEASKGRRQTAQIDTIHIPLASLEAELLSSFQTLERVKGTLIESRPDALGGEPVLTGTRVAARHIADLLKQGATKEELAEDYDLTLEQIEAAAIFDRVTPRRGRPPVRKTRTEHVPAA